MTPIRHTGSCLCGAIRFTISGPLAPIQVCHCGQCRKAQGGPLATNIPVETAHLQLEVAGDALRHFEATPGKRRAFCATCGSPVYSERAGLPGVVRIRAGLIDAPLQSRPGFHQHVASACEWWTIDDDLPRHAAGHVAPDPAEGIAPAAPARR